MNKEINFFKYKYIFIIISALIIFSGIIYGLITGYRFDIDFKGGTTIQVNLNEAYKSSDVESIVKEVSNQIPLVQNIGTDNTTVAITTNVIDEETQIKVTNSLREKYTKMDEPSVRNVQPSYGKELINSAVLAMTVSIILLLLYIGVRFKTLGFKCAIAAIIALLHDALFIVSVYGIFKFPINSTFVAVILTILGYSINDTIIVYDRIRENKKNVKMSKDLDKVINVSISQTMGRTILTSFTTFTAVAVVFVLALIYGQNVLKEFALPLMIGVVVGTYSSVFIATSLLYIFDGIEKKYFSKNKKSKKRK